MGRRIGLPIGRRTLVRCGPMRWAGQIIPSTAFFALMSCTSGGSDDGMVEGADGPPAGTTSVMEESTGTEPMMGEPRSLARSDAWELAGGSDDPFEDRPEFVQCEIGWDVVTGVFEVDSSVCTYAAFMQPTLVPIEAGDEIEVLIQHGPLSSEDDDAPAHIAIAFGSEIVWETDVAIPADAGDAVGSWTASQDVQVGTPLHLHLHDHGTTFRVATLMVTNGS